MPALRRRRRGVATIEWVILTPLVITMFVLLLYVMFVGLAYIHYNNLADQIAQDFNMRPDGYYSTPSREYTVYFYQGSTDITPRGDGSAMDAFRQFLRGFESNPTPVEMKIGSLNPSGIITTVLRDSVYRHGDKLHLPGVAVTEINSKIMKGDRIVNYSRDMKNYLGSTVEIVIKYKVFGLEFEAVGYSMIS